MIIIQAFMNEGEKLCQNQNIRNSDNNYFKYLYRSMDQLLTWVIKNFVILSGNLPFSLDKIISSMSPWSFSITTNTLSGVSNMHSKFTTPGWWRF